MSTDNVHSVETEALFWQQSPMILVSIVTAVFSTSYHVHGENDENSCQSPVYDVQARPTDMRNRPPPTHDHGDAPAETTGTTTGATVNLGASVPQIHEMAS